MRGHRPGSDPYAYVISANIHRRHLTAEQKRELIAKVIKATRRSPTGRSRRRPRPITRRSASVRRRRRHVGKFPTFDTRTDSKGRQQPARKPSEPHRPGKKVRGDAEPSGCRDVLGRPVTRVQPILFDAPARETISRQRDDIGTVSNGEIARKDARIDELQAEKRRLEIENVGAAQRGRGGQGGAQARGRARGATNYWRPAASLGPRPSQERAAKNCKARIGLVDSRSAAARQEPRTTTLTSPPWLRRTAP